MRAEYFGTPKVKTSRARTVDLQVGAYVLDIVAVAAGNVERPANAGVDLARAPAFPSARFPDTHHSGGSRSSKKGVPDTHQLGVWRSGRDQGCLNPSEPTRLSAGRLPTFPLTQTLIADLHCHGAHLPQ